MTLLIIICSRYPNPHLNQNIANLREFYENEKIVVVDSDSDNFQYYDEIRQKYINVDYLFVKNKHYEYGAYKIGYTLYPNYDYYLCIQDSVIITKKIDISTVNGTTAYTYHNYSGFYLHPSIKELAIELTKETYVYDDKLINAYFNLATHCSFLVSNAILRDMYDKLPNPPTNKDGSCAYERIFGMYFIKIGITTLNIADFTYKIHGLR